MAGAVKDRRARRPVLSLRNSPVVAASGKGHNLTHSALRPSYCVPNCVKFIAQNGKYALKIGHPPPDTWRPKAKIGDVQIYCPPPRPAVK